MVNDEFLYNNDMNELLLSTNVKAYTNRNQKIINI